MTTPESSGRRFRAYTVRHLDDLLKRAPLTEEQRLRTRAVASVLPFRTNTYVVDELIDWDNAFDDPMFRLVFPQEDMLPAEDVDHLAELLQKDAPKQEITAAANQVRFKLNPHPAGQIQLNIKAKEDAVEGLQHKYKETVLFFPSRGRPVTPTAPTASAGRSSWASTSSRWPTTTSRSSPDTCAATRRSPACC
ncbi:hypothetical protein GCM10029992_43510 [Glycomyces albus]